MPGIPSIHTGPVVCPSCAQPAAITERFALSSTDGPVAHVKVRCPGGHWYTAPSSRVRSYNARLQDLAA